MNELVNVLKSIQIDLRIIAVTLILFLICKDCHGNTSGIVEELRNIKELIRYKR